VLTCGWVGLAVSSKIIGGIAAVTIRTEGGAARRARAS